MTFFKTGCYILIITCCIHLIGHFIGASATNETERQLLDLMTTTQFDVGSGTITMMDYQQGLSLCFSLLFLWTGVTGLLLVKPLSQNPPALRKIAIVYTGALAIETAISVTYFFIFPTTCIALALVFCGISVFRIK